MKFASTFLALSTILTTKAFAPPRAFAPNVKSGTQIDKQVGGRYSSTCTELNLLGGPVYSKVIDLLVERELIEQDVLEVGLGMETRLILGEVSCGLTQALAVALGTFFTNNAKGGGIGESADLETEEVNLGWEKILGKWRKTRVRTTPLVDTDKFKTDILKRDDMSKNDIGMWKELKSLKIMQLGFEIISSSLFPIDDSDVSFADEAQAARMNKDLKFVPGEALPVTYNTDFNMQTDASFSRIFFNGMAAPLMAKSDKVTDPEHLKYGPYVVDLTFLKDIPIRNEELFKRYGARVHFDENRLVSAIYESDSDKLYLPGQEGWEEAKFQSKATAVALCTVREHLAHTHLIVSNAASREIVRTLPPDHPIRRLLAIFTYNAVSVNLQAAGVLIPERSVLHRSTPFTYEGIKIIFDHTYESSKAFEPFTKQEIKNPTVEKLAYEDDNTVSSFPYLTDGRAYYNIVVDMVTKWLEEAGDEASDEHALEFYEAMKESSKGQAYEIPDYSHENMIDVISTVIFTVTAFHELIGHVPDYVDSPSKMAFRVTRNSPLKADVQGYYLVAMIGAATSAPAPQLMDYFENFIGVGEGNEWEKSIWTKFIADMGVQAKKVQEDDRTRNSDSEYKYFDPTLFECSVSV